MIDIIAKVDALKESKIKIYPAHTNRASSLGDDCERKLVYQRTSWEQAQPHSVELQYIFDEGNNQEETVLNDLRQAGFIIKEQQKPFSFKEHQITGSIDGMISEDGQNFYPIEIKSMSPFIWDTIDTKTNESLIESLSKKPWTRKYLAQMVLYLLMGNSESGIFIFKNKTNGLLKQATINLSDHLELAESLIQRADRINDHVANNTLPNQIENTCDCDKCPFVHICCPDIVTDGMEIINDAELEASLELREKYADAKKKYEEIDKEIKSKIKGRILSVGEWMISGKWIDVKAETEPRPARKDWRPKIERISK